MDARRYSCEHPMRDTPLKASARKLTVLNCGGIIDHSTAFVTDPSLRPSLCNCAPQDASREISRHFAYEMSGE